MKIRKDEFLIENDIILSHLIQNEMSEHSILELAMLEGICFTTALNSSELLFNCKYETERESVYSVLTALKVLGIHPRYSLNISEFFNKVATVRDAMICSLAKINKLPILTDDSERYSNSGIKIISSTDLRGLIATR